MSHYASIWGNAVSIGENRPESYGKNITLRYPVYSHFAGDALRITYDNYCGTEAVTITRTTIRIGGQFLPVTFQGDTAVTIPAGEAAESDELACDIQAQHTFDVSFYLGDFTQMRSCVYACGPFSNKALYATGDQTENPEISIEDSRPTHYFYFLSNVSVRTADENRTIVCYGDSITAQDWPDDLMARCRREGYDHTAIIRRATSGSRILRQYSCLTYQSYGLMGSKRFHHEVPTDGADTVIIQQGINDIIHPVGTDVNPFRPMSDLPTVQQLTNGLKKYIEQARSYGYKVYVGTLLPIEGWRTYAPFREDLKNAYNDWIRTTDLIDGCIDFDLAIRDPHNPKAFAKGCDSGDHLHPSKEGYVRMAEAVPEGILII
ncbi:MAG: GDSL-type esterase/lipase family protein [Butyrivibrio sp.]|jgi:lysophospholipase L1-like esterase|nr:GDSL-type esterase/lipase family protein [Butyrivibrio sp.]